MQSSKYHGELNPEMFGIEMKQAFKLYPRNIVLKLAESKIYSGNKLKTLKNGCDINE